MYKYENIIYACYIRFELIPDEEMEQVLLVPAMKSSCNKPMSLTLSQRSRWITNCFQWGIVERQNMRVDGWTLPVGLAYQSVLPITAITMTTGLASM